MHSDNDVAIFWDYENCHAAAHISGYEIVKKIRHIAHDFGSIKLFKAYLELSEPVAYSKSLNLRSELQSSGVSLTDTPHNGRKDVADKMMLVDMLAHAIDNPPPATIILISGDRDFAYAVSILRSRRYRVVIISLGGVHISLKAQASVFLDWNTDILGMDFTEQGTCSNNGRNDLRGISTSTRPQMAPQNATSSLSNPPNRYTLREPDIGVLHLRSDSLNLQKASYDNDIEVLPKELSPEHVAPSHRSRSNTQDSISTSEIGTPTFRAPSRTESAPAAMSTSPTLASHDAIPEKIHPPENTTTLPPKTSTLSNAKPASEVVNTPQETRNENLTRKQSVPQPVLPAMAAVAGAVVPPTKPQNIPTASAVPVPPVVHVPVPVDTSSESVQTTEPKLTPPVFNLLVQRLEFHRSKGVTRPFRSGVAVELATQDNMLYRRAGTERFGQYVALAEKAGIIELGGKEGGAWIALRPEWYGARPSP